MSAPEEAPQGMRTIRDCFGHAVGEEEIDLAATHGVLLGIEYAIQKATEKHNEFLKEPGQPLLPSVD